jgi:hypothetical protein
MMQSNIFDVLSDVSTDDTKHETNFLKENSKAARSNVSVLKYAGSHRISYEKRIEIIRDYFGVSEMCAIYLYHRRRRGVPWYKPGEPKYLEWSIQLQNAILHLDTIHAFDWHGLEFGYEEIHFTKNNIDLNSMSTEVSVLSEPSHIYSENIDKDGFIPVGKHKINITRELNKMGLIPRAYCVE